VKIPIGHEDSNLSRCEGALQKSLKKKRNGLIQEKKNMMMNIA